MKLQKIISKLQKLHPKEIDLSLDRIKNLCAKLGNPQDDIQSIQICGTNGKGSTISFLHAILKEAKIFSLELAYTNTINKGPYLLQTLFNDKNNSKNDK